MCFVKMECVGMEHVQLRALNIFIIRYVGVYLYLAGTTRRSFSSFSSDVAMEIKRCRTAWGERGELEKEGM